MAIDKWGYMKLSFIYDLLGAKRGSNDGAQMGRVIRYLRTRKYLLNSLGITWNNFRLHLELYIIDLDNYEPHKPLDEINAQTH